MLLLEKRFMNREGLVISIHSSGSWVRVSTVDPLTLKEIVVQGEPDDDREELVKTLFQKLNSILGDRFPLKT